jgi:segregation and condensation protein B
VSHADDEEQKVNDAPFETLPTEEATSDLPSVDDVPAKDAAAIDAAAAETEPSAVEVQASEEPAATDVPTDGDGTATDVPQQDEDTVVDGIDDATTGEWSAADALGDDDVVVDVHQADEVEFAAVEETAGDEPIAGESPFDEETVTTSEPQADNQPDDQQAPMDDGPLEGRDAPIAASGQALDDGVDVSEGAGGLEALSESDEAQVLRRGSAELKAILEALIFASPEPLTFKAIGKLLDGESKDDVQAALVELKTDYERPGGLQLVEVAGGYQIVTRSDLHEWVRRLFHERSTQKLSVQALETLAVVAYRQPVTALEITEIRGVNSSGVMNTLLERHLIKIVGRKQVVGRPFMYATTKEFLIRFGLNDLGDLPRVEDMAVALGIESPLLIEQVPPEEQLPLEEPQDEDEPTDTNSGGLVH